MFVSCRSLDKNTQPGNRNGAEQKLGKKLCFPKISMLGLFSFSQVDIQI